MPTPEIIGDCTGAILPLPTRTPGTLYLILPSQAQGHLVVEAFVHRLFPPFGGLFCEL